MGWLEGHSGSNRRRPRPWLYEGTPGAIGMWEGPEGAGGAGAFYPTPAPAPTPAPTPPPIIPGQNIQKDANEKQNLLTSLTTASGATTSWQNYISSNRSTPAGSSITTNFSSPSLSQPGILEQTNKNSGPLITIGTTNPLLQPGSKYRLAGWYATTEGYQSSDAMFNAVYDLEHKVDDPKLFPIKSLNSAQSLSINEDFSFSSSAA